MKLCLTPCLAQSQRMRLEQLAISGGASCSVFPVVEMWLQESTDHWNALRSISARKGDCGYWSVVDFVLVSVCPSLRESCLAFYAGNGPALRDMVTEAERRYYERRCVAFLEIAYAVFSEKRRMSWSAAVELVDILEVA